MMYLDANKTQGSSIARKSESVSPGATNSSKVGAVYWGQSAQTIEHSRVTDRQMTAPVSPKKAVEPREDPSCLKSGPEGENCVYGSEISILDKRFEMGTPT